MQQPSSHYSLDLSKERYINVALLNEETELCEDLSGSSSPEDAVFSLCETQEISVCMDVTMPPGDCIHPRSYMESSLFLKLPTEEHDENHHAPFQFDRHALARISTSPTLRRLRMASASQTLSFQDRALTSSDTAQLGIQKEYTGSLHHICKSPPRCTKSSSLSLPSCVHAKLLSSKAKTETTTADPESADPRSKLPSQKDPLSNGSQEVTLQHLWKTSSATLPVRLPHPSPMQQEGVQEFFKLISSHAGEEHFRSFLYHKEGKAIKCAVVASHRSADRRRSSVVVSLPGLEVFPGDLLISDGAMDYLPPAALLLNTGQTQAGVCPSQPR
nr:PREDICTED: uncharacterized protein C12orf74 homolog [Struthio camelus australis]